jgi:hypothetical protein
MVPMMVPTLLLPGPGNDIGVALLVQPLAPLHVFIPKVTPMGDGATKGGQPQPQGYQEYFGHGFK